MSSKYLIYRHMFVFYILGHIAYNPHVPAKNFISIALQFIPSLLLLLLVSIISMDLMKFQLFAVIKWDKTDSFVGGIFLTSENVCSVSAILISIYNYDDVLEIAEHFHSIEINL